MIKVFCDRCNKEIKDNGRQIYTGVYDALGVLITTIGAPKHLCKECSAKLDAIKDQLKHEEDIFDMTDDAIELLQYTFKVGDEVITANGRTGKITDICTCDRCKERGFYEANIEFYDGDTDYIMISDKKNGFKSYYSIGDRVFGNLDEESVHKEIVEYFVRISKLQQQHEIIANIKKKTNEI